VEIDVARCGLDPDDDKVRVVIDGTPTGPMLWPSEAAIVVDWLEKVMRAQRR
jgi:hypothetical protein